MSSLPAGLTWIGDSTFAGCINLTLTELPAGLTTIGSAFRDCIGLTEITIYGDFSLMIASSIFDGCINLALITCFGETPPNIEGGAAGFLDDTAPGLEIRVPAAYIELYKAASGWSKWSGIISGF
jgi:hypothetical protein